MNSMVLELQGKRILANIFTAIWLGNWNQYEKIFKEMPDEMSAEFPFHRFYNRERVELWHENHFSIPGDYFVSPYFSSYSKKEQEEDDTRTKDLLCLIGLYEKTGFYYPLEKDLYPDHIGCLTAFLSSILFEQIKAIQEQDDLYSKTLIDIENEIVNQYIKPVLPRLLKEAKKKVDTPFLKEFLLYYSKMIKNDWHHAA